MSGRDHSHGHFGVLVKFIQKHLLERKRGRIHIQIPLAVASGLSLYLIQRLRGIYNNGTKIAIDGLRVYQHSEENSLMR